MPPYQIKSLTNVVSELDNEIDLPHLDGNCAEDYDDTTFESSCTEDVDSIESPVPSARQCRHVQFLDADKVVPILGISDYTFAEHRSSWYSPYEINQMSFFREKLVSRLEKGKVCKCIQGKEMTYRGLESWTQAGANILRQSNRNVVQATLTEQARQRELGYYDPETIASKIITFTAASRQRALCAGKIDEEDALQLYAGKKAALVKSNEPHSRRSWSWSFNKSLKRTRRQSN